MKLHQPQITYINAKAHALKISAKFDKEVSTPSLITAFDAALDAQDDAQDALIKWAHTTYPAFAQLDCYTELDIITQDKLANVLSKRLD